MKGWSCTVSSSPSVPPNLTDLGTLQDTGMFARTIPTQVFLLYLILTYPEIMCCVLGCHCPKF